MTKGDFRQDPKKNQNTTHFGRLDRLHVVTGKTWNQIAEELGVDRSLLFHVKAGTRNLSPKLLFRLERAEILAGITDDAKGLVRHTLGDKDIAPKMLGETAQIEDKVTVLDVDRGYKDVPLEYRRGSPPSGYHSAIRLFTPTNAIIWRIIGRSGVIDDPTKLLLACLPKNCSKTDFLNLLTPGCYLKLVEIAMGLVFGPKRQQKR